MTTGVNNQPAGVSSEQPGTAPAGVAPTAPVVVPPAVGFPAPTAQPAAPATGGAEVAAPVEYDKTGDVGLDYALSFVGNLGFGPEHPAMVAAMKGDFSLIQAQLATLGPKAAGYPEIIKLAEQSYQATVKAHEANEKALGQLAEQAAGSAERWAQVQAWASANADPDEKASINAALSAGGVQARMAIEYLVRCYDKSAGSVKEPQRAVAPGASASSAAPVPMTASEYAKQVQALARAANGRDITGTAEYRVLQNQRLAARRAGI